MHLKNFREGQHKAKKINLKGKKKKKKKKKQKKKKKKKKSFATHKT